MASGWKVLGGFQPDGTVLELYTGVSPENQPPAFAPETNLTLASSPRRPMAAHSRTSSLRHRPSPISLPAHPCVYSILGLGQDALRLNPNESKPGNESNEKTKHIARVCVLRFVSSRFERGNGNPCHGSGQSTRSAAAADPARVRLRAILFRVAIHTALIKGLARCNRKGRLTLLDSLIKVDSGISSQIEWSRIRLRMTMISGGFSNSSRGYHTD